MKKSLSMKKILLITSRADVGGGPKHLFDLISDLKKRDNYQIFTAAPDEEPFASKYRNASFRFIPLPKRKFTLFSFFRLLIICKSNEITLVHSHGRGAGVFSRLLGLFSIKVIHTFHGAHKTDDFLGFLKVTLDKVLKNLTNKFICVSNDEKLKVIELGMAFSESITVIENGINVSEIHSSNTREKKSEVKTFGTLARLNHQKGLDLAINYFSKLGENFQLLIAGEGEDQEKLLHLIKENNVQDRVKLIGNVGRPSELFEQIDAYISTARWEGLPIAVLEAMAYPNACILSNVTGHGPFIENGACLSFELNCYDSFKVAIEEVQSKKDLLEERSYALVKRRFDLKEMVNKVEEVYR